MKIIKDASILSFQDEFEVKYDPNLDNSDLDDYCTVVEAKNERINGVVSKINEPRVHFNTPYSNQPLFIDFEEGVLRASGDGELLGTNITVFIDDGTEEITTTEGEGAFLELEDGDYTIE